ncbi:MAG TPA: GDSL-type esterase/lipase family protein [Candidatus Saccharimonadales bacterium]|nr:GDSL-type esterase/lipase family protein [Candidatus Saccharimonadales bacterium]
MANKTILIYGDSNVHGEAAFNERRLDEDQRWVNIVAGRLGGGYTIIAEGYSGRTAGDLKTGAWLAHANGQAHFTAIYGSHTPIDVVIIALGTNDCHPEYGQTAADIVVNLQWYRQQVEEYGQRNANSPVPRVVHITPPAFRPSDDYFAADPALQQELYEALLVQGPDTITVPAVDLSDDGVHFSPQGHTEMAEAVLNWIEMEGI